MEIKQDTSYGVIPLQWVNNTWQVLLVEQYNQSRGDSYWTFPKGHAEPGETPIMTAKRELHEETNLEVSAILEEPVFSMAYEFTLDGIKIEKVVYYYLGLVSNQDVIVQVAELRSAKWCFLAEAPTLLSFPNIQSLSREVSEYLASQTQEVFINIKMV